MGGTFDVSGRVAVQARRGGLATRVQASAERVDCMLLFGTGPWRSVGGEAVFSIDSRPCVVATQPCPVERLQEADCLRAVSEHHLAPRRGAHRERAQGRYCRASARDDARGMRLSPSTPAFLAPDVGAERSVSQAMLNYRCQRGKQIPESDPSRAWPMNTVARWNDCAISPSAEHRAARSAAPRWTILFGQRLTARMKTTKSAAPPGVAQVARTPTIPAHAVLNRPS
jgi:hypothetical protein